jgi:hypothetical protein
MGLEPLGFPDLTVPYIERQMAHDIGLAQSWKLAPQGDP